MLEVAIAFTRHNYSSMSATKYSYGSTSSYPLAPLLDAMSLLQKKMIIAGYADEFDLHGGDFSALLRPWSGMIVVDNGDDLKWCTDHGLYRTFSVVAPQRQIFMIDDDESFFLALLSARPNGPLFLHRDLVHAV